MKDHGTSRDRSRPQPSSVDADAAGSDHDASPPRVLVIHAHSRTRSGVLRKLRPATLACEGVASLKAARTIMEANEYDVIAVAEDLSDGRGSELVQELRATTSHVRCIVLSDDASMDGAREAIQSGACDYIELPCSAADIRSRLERVADLARRAREQAEHVDQLREVCRTLNSARQEMTQHVNTLCDDLVDAYEELADQMNDVALSSEFRALMSQELDVETLLRTMLEFMLKRTGPTNAAVFLPTGHSDYSLGAYVNYDIPRDSADMLLDHLADVLAPRLAREVDIVHTKDDAHLARLIGEDASWLTGSHLASLTCMREGRPLAIISLFRDGARPFTPEVLAEFHVMAGIFADQLGRVIKVHNRMLPEDEWSGFEFDDGEDDVDEGWDLAA